MRDWARWCRRALVAAGVVALAMGGVSIFGQPDREILYQPEPPLTVCGVHGCTFIYRLEVGNSGAGPQDEVIVRLRREIVEGAILPVEARNYGKIDRSVRVWDEGSVRAYALGRLESQARVELGFVLHGKTPDAVVPWPEVLAGVEAPGAAVSVPALLVSSVHDSRPSLVDAIGSASWLSIGAAVYLGIVATVVAYAGWGSLLQRYPTAVVAPFALIAPCTGVLASALVFREVFGPILYAGMLLILGGLAVIVLPTSRKGAGSP